MKILQAYKHITGYLHRWTVVKLGPLHIRIHNIRTPDQTPFLHSHPFHYISIILRGGYSERYLNVHGKLVCLSHKPGHVIVRRAERIHRIDSVNPSCFTLFITWKAKAKWGLVRHPDVRTPSCYKNYRDGLYRVDGKFRKRASGVWYGARDTLSLARECDVISIYQHLKAQGPLEQ